MTEGAVVPGLEQLDGTLASGELGPITPGGARWVELAERHADVFAGRAVELDATGAFPHQNFAEMRESGFMGAFVPEELGGLGATLIHDWAVAIERLARADASTAIAVSMHFIGLYTLLRLWREAEANELPQAAALADQLRSIAQGKSVRCGLGTESGTSLAAPRTTAVRADGGWLLNGRKAFGTSTPEADLVLVQARVDTEEGPRLGYALVPKGAPGVQHLDNWDALGMRSSGSQDVVLEDVFVPEQLMIVRDRWGEIGAGLLAGMVPAMCGLAGAFLGIAEAARMHIGPMLQKRRKGPSDLLAAERPIVQHCYGELEVQLAACRAILARSCLAADRYYATTAPSQDALEGMAQVMRHVQCAKQFVNREAVGIVDRAMTLSGGSGYSNKSPLSRMYRDVRAGGFMQPFSPIEGFGFIARVALDGDLTLAD